MFGFLVETAISADDSSVSVLTCVVLSLFAGFHRLAETVFSLFEPNFQFDT